MKTLTIKLTSPLQSYGDEATFLRRTSGSYPSKSAIVGLLAAALGYSRDDVRILKLNELSFAVRIDQVGVSLTDFQTVVWKKGKGGTKVSYRDYLQDAVFVVAIGGDDEAWIDAIHYALLHPHFQLFLGRRANAPAGVLETALFSDIDPVAALKTVQWQAADWYRKKHRNQSSMILDIIADANLIPTDRTQLVKDKVGSFDQRNRYFEYRGIALDSVEVTNNRFEDNRDDTAHDIMGSL